MSTITPVQAGDPTVAGVKLVTWTMGNADTGIGVKTADFADKTISATGTFGGATIVVSGSNDSTNGTDGTWTTINDATQAALSKTAAFLLTILENPLWIRVVTSGGSGTTITAILVARK